MPALSPTMQEGTLAKWHVKVGDTVKSGDVIAEIETDKATMEVEAVDEGVVEAILVPEGAEEVKVNTPIARLSGEDGASASSAVKSEPAGTRISSMTPSSTASTSMVALSVSISAITSPDLTLSPSFLSHLARLPFSIVGESAGINTGIGIGVLWVLCCRAINVPRSSIAPTDRAPGRGSQTRPPH